MYAVYFSHTPPYLLTKSKPTYLLTKSKLGMLHLAYPSIRGSGNTPDLITTDWSKVLVFSGLKEGLLVLIDRLERSFYVIGTFWVRFC